MIKLKEFNKFTMIDGKWIVGKQSCDYKKIKSYQFFTKYWIAIGGCFVQSNA